MEKFLKKTVMSLRYTKTPGIFRSPKRLPIICWKMTGALHSPCSIKVGLKGPLLKISAHFSLPAGERSTY